MIPLVAAIPIAAAIGVGLLFYVGVSMNEIQELYADSAMNTQERLQERLVGEYEGSPTNIEQSFILSEWTDDTRVVGVMVECPGGEIFTAEEDITIPGGQLEQLPRDLMDNLQDLAGECPP